MDRETLFWTCEGEEPCEALEKIDLGDGMDASIFLHGVCGIFALALHETFGYGLWVVAFEPENWGDEDGHMGKQTCPYLLPEGRLLH